MEGALSAGHGRLKISELAEEAGVPVATVRHYLREGLLPEGEKTSRNMAYYPPELVDRIKLIKQLQEERFMPLRVIAELLEREGSDSERLRALAETEDRVLELALADERERFSPERVAETTGVPVAVLGRLAELGVVGDRDQPGLSPLDTQIVEAIARFRAAGYDESVGFTVHDAAGFLEPLEALADRELGLLTDKLVGGEIPADRAVEMFEAGLEPLRSLIDAMHSRALVRELSRRHPRADGEG